LLVCPRPCWCVLFTPEAGTTGEQGSRAADSGRMGGRGTGGARNPWNGTACRWAMCWGVGVKIIPQSGTKKRREERGELAAKGVRDAVAGNSGHNNHFSARGDTVGPRWASGSLDMNAPHGHTALMGTGRRTAEGDKAEAVPCNAQYNRPLGAKRQHSATEERRRREHRRMALRTGGREQSGGFRPDGSEWEGQEMSGTHGMQAFGAGAGSKLRSVRGGKKAPATDAGGRHGPKENTGGNSGL
jgi:hypothetical protein